MPYVHKYEPKIGSQAFKTRQGIFIVLDRLFGDTTPDQPMLFRPHAYLLETDGMTMEKYQALPETEKNVEWPLIQSALTWSDGPTQTFFTCDFSVHGEKDDLGVSYQNPAIGKLEDLLKKGPFVSEIKSPDKYRVKTLHVVSSELSKKLPKTTDELLEYFKNLQLSFEQQKFIIKQLFPFLTV